MIGRGTRRWTDPETGQLKKDFLIIDFWNNFAYFNMNPEGEVASPTEPLPMRLFRLRLEKLVLLRGLDKAEAAEGAVTQLRAMLAQIPPRRRLCDAALGGVSGARCIGRSGKNWTAAVSKS